MNKFYALKVSDVRHETQDCVSIAFDVSNGISEAFKFEPGQYLTLKTKIGDEDIRRCYSICSAPLENELRVAIKKVIGGTFSTYANEALQTGQEIDVMAPEGNFVKKTSPSASNTYVAFVAGSGITPIMSLLKDTLSTEENAEFILFYGNKSTDQIIFREELEALKNKYINRIQIFYLLSEEIPDTELFAGRLNADKVNAYAKYLFRPTDVDQFFLCGPETMIWSVKSALEALDVDTAKISFELFTSSSSKTHEKYVGTLSADEVQNESTVTVIQDGTSFEMSVPYKGQTILDAALKKGADLPFACKGGVCCTCKARLLSGEVEMEVNYALEPVEVEAGFVLTCQSHPRTKEVKLDFDV
jgi:ring-1,2-phenylacetyl-CoA epoxidase subunit PaaE